MPTAIYFNYHFLHVDRNFADGLLHGLAENFFALAFLTLAGAAICLAYFISSLFT